MSAPESSHLAPVAERLAGKHLLVTGSTGFLAKVFVEKLLRGVDSIGGIHLLVRPRSDGTSPRRRVVHEVLGSSVFDRLRAALGEGFGELCERKIDVVAGDLTRERMGLDRAAYEALTQRIDLVVNSAATVTFDEQIDLAVHLNTLGPQQLLLFARDAGNIPFMHVSTCYVCGARKGTVVEDFSAPEAAREKLPRLPSGEFDLDRLVDSVLAEATEIRHRLAADQEACRRELIEAGMRLARHYGWNDTYTFTKWIGEQLLIRDRGDVPLVIFRPAIIEGSFDEPTPGWIDGLRMADPIIVAFGRGKISEFPGVWGLTLDLIPADFVANGMIATLPVGDDGMNGPRVYQCGSSERHPLYMKEMALAIERAFIKRPMIDDDGRPIRPGRLKLIPQNVFVAKYQRMQRRLGKLQRLYAAVGITGRRGRRLAAISRQIEQLIYFAKIYSPYTHLDCRFADDELRAAGERLHPDDQAMLPFDAQRIDWDDYMVNRHVPGLRAYVLGKGGEPMGRIRAVEASLCADRSAPTAILQDAKNLFDVFRRAAERYGAKPALQVRRAGQWIRYTYEEALRATGTIMNRLRERGLEPGDRLAICAESGPEWGLTYLAAMRAGLIAVPLDPQLPPREAWAAARFAGASLMCVSPNTHDGILEQRREDDADVLVMRPPFIPQPGASRDRLPDPVPVEDNQTASILFTSGTTVTPKAVQLSHRNLIANAQALVGVHHVNPDDELLSVLPMYHAFEFTGGFLVPLVGGATITYVDQLRGPDILAAMQATGTTIMLVVPRLLRLFHNSIEHRLAEGGRLTRGVFKLLGVLSELSGRRLARLLFGTVHKRFGGRLRMFVCGGSRLDPDLFDAFERMGFKVYEGYGLTETSPVLTVNPPGANRRGSVGPPLPNVELEVRNENLERIGEVWVKGPCVMSGYLNNVEATREVLVDGWLRTGDLGRLDGDGYLCLTGRSKDLIVTGAGKNVYPDEVEVHYRDLPYTKELCVFGMLSPDGLGEVVHAVVVLDPEAAPELDRSTMEREIRQAAANISESLPSHQRLSRLHFWERELPKTSTMKAKRGLIREIVCTEGATGADDAGDDVRDAVEPDRTVINDAAVAALRVMLARHSKVPADKIEPHQHLHLDLGIDSIGKIDLLGSIESRFGMRIDDEAATKIARVIDLYRAVGDRVPLDQPARPSDVWHRRLGRESAALKPNGRMPLPLLPMRWAVRGTMSALMNTYIRVQVRGRENLPKEGPFILAPNHTSHLDTPSIFAAVGGRRRVWVAGAEDYFFNTRLKRLLFGRCLDTISFDRHADGVLGLRRCGEALRRGDGLLIFPEGTRSLTGAMQSFKIGIAVLASEHGVPIVPVHIHRAYDLLPKGSRIARPGTITVTFGRPILPPTDEPVEDRYAAFKTLTEQVERAVEALSTEASRS